MKTNQTRYLSTLSTADYLGLSKSTLEKWRLTGDGPPFIKIGRRVVYDITVVDAWLAAHQFESTSEADIDAAHRGQDASSWRTRICSSLATRAR